MKLSSLKKWLTLEEASKQLSLLFDEEVEPNDILKLALDGQIQLSIYMRAPHIARKWVKKGGCDDLLTLKKGEAGYVGALATEEKLEPEHEHEISSSLGVAWVQNLWDLPMVGDEKFEIEKMLFNKISEYNYKRPNHNVGFCVFSESIGLFEIICFDQFSGGYTTEKGKQLISALRKPITLRESDNSNFDYWPLFSMPRVSTLVLRPDSIFNFVNKLKSDEAEVLSDDKEKTYLSIIAALLNLLVKEPKSNRTQESVAEELQEKYKEFAKSFSVSNLTKIFPRAKSALKDKIKEK